MRRSAADGPKMSCLMPDTKFPARYTSESDDEEDDEEDNEGEDGSGKLALKTSCTLHEEEELAIVLRPYQEMSGCPTLARPALIPRAGQIANL